MDYDMADFYDNVDSQFADDEEALGNLVIHDEPDPFAKYQVSDEQLRQAIMEEEALLANKENNHPTTTDTTTDTGVTPSSTNMTTALENQLKSLTDRMVSVDTAKLSTPDSYPEIEFSFMQNSATASLGSTDPPALQIRNSYRAGQGKRRVTGDEIMGDSDEEGPVEEVSSKRSRSDPEQEKVLTRVPDGDFIKVTSDTQRIFLRVKPYIEKVNLQTTPDCLLDQPFQFLKAQVMRDYHEKRAEVEAAVLRIRSHVVPAARSRDPLSRDTDRSNLWVSDYMPTKYIDLLSDDGVNRSVLHWLKLWDGVVFGKKMREKAPVEKPKWLTLEQWQRYQNKQEPDYDEKGFPYRKTILLAGPPGLGKTTLAHVSARHAGYNVIEMNASDDRSAAQFAEAIENSTRMSGVLNKDNRPNCLIIDEIDGAGAPAIQVLVNVLNAGTRFTPDEQKTKKKNKKEHRLRRPIICICNDPWGVALRDLRKVATIMIVPPTQSARLASRLKGICNMEQLTADMASLLYLCEKTDNDIRSSLNTLQFLKSNNEPLSMIKLRSMDVGLKDKQQSLFKFWSLILTQPKTKGSALQRLTNDQKHDQKRMSDLLSLIMGTGEYEKQVEGIHENLLLLKIREASFPKLVDSLDWFIFYDLIDVSIRESMTFDLYTYLTYTPLAFHLLFAQVHPPKVTLPSKEREVRQRSGEVGLMCDMMKKEVLVKARLGLSSEYLATELAAYIVRLLCPPFRPVNIQLYSEAERRSKEALVSLMSCYDLQFVQHRTPEGVVSYQLEPDLFSVATFPGTSEIKQLSYSIKQMLAREVELRRIGDVDGLKSSQNTPKSKAAEEAGAGHKPAEKIDFTKEAVPVNYLSKVVSNKDAFKRKKEAYTQKNRTFYKFNEGFSNAVRKPVKMSVFF